MSRNISKLLGRKGLKESLLKKIIKGEEAENLAKDFLVGKSTIEGSQSFYEFLGDDHSKNEAYVCTGTACLCSGDVDKTRSILEQQLGKEKVGSMICLGHCYEANAFQYKGENYSGDRRVLVLSELEETESPIKARCVSSQAILTDNRFATVTDFANALNKLLSTSATEALEQITLSGLRGRGGAGFPTGVKWASCLEIEAATKYIVCNADEGDPGAFSDRYLMEAQAHRVIFGMMAAAWIVGSKEGVIYIRAEYPQSIREISKTIDALHDEGLLGENIQGTGFDFEIQVVEGAGAYICGEETALIASIEGRRPEVDVRPPFPTVEGLFKKPTVLNNVETFAAIEKILSLGGEAYAKLGTKKSRGTKLISLDAGFVNPGIVEVEMGMKLTELIEIHAGGFKQPTKALHIGGPLGGLVPVSEITSLTVDYETFSEAGFLLGHASVVCIPEAFPIIQLLRHLFEFTAAESCGKCFPCRIGSTRGKEMFTQAISGERLMDRSLLDDLLDTLEQGSLCALGGGLPLPIKNALQYFEVELSEFFSSVGLPDKTIDVRRLS